MTHEPWPTSNPHPEKGEWWVQFNHRPGGTECHALMRGNDWWALIASDPARSIAAQLGQPLPSRTETVEVPDGHHVEVVPDGLVMVPRYAAWDLLSYHLGRGGASCGDASVAALAIEESITAADASRASLERDA